MTDGIKFADLVEVQRMLQPKYRDTIPVEEWIANSISERLTLNGNPAAPRPLGIIVAKSN